MSVADLINDGGSAGATGLLDQVPSPFSLTGAKSHTSTPTFDLPLVDPPFPVDVTVHQPRHTRPPTTWVRGRAQLPTARRHRADHARRDGPGARRLLTTPAPQLD